MQAEFSDREERPAWVQFEQRPIEDKKASLAAGHTVMKNVEFALVTPPYSKDCFEFKVEQWFKNQEQNVRNGRIPESWLKHWKAGYEAWKQGLETPLHGTDIRNWPVLSPAQVKNLINAGCRTIEDLAAANEEGLRRIGMGGIELKNKANAYLQAAKDHGPLVLENTELKNQVAQLQGSVESLSAQVQALLNQTEKPIEIDAIELDDLMNEDPIQDLGISSPISLEDQYEQKFGEKPHHRMKPETIKQKLDEAI